MPNPFTPQILKLSAELEALRRSPVAPMFSAEEIAERQRRQSTEEDLGVLAKLSGDQALQSAGSPVLTRALAQGAPRITEHGEYDPTSGSLRVFPQYTRRVAEERLARELHQMELRSAQHDALEPYRSATADAQRALAEARRAKAEADAAKAGDGKTLTGQVYKDIKKMGEDADVLDTITSTFSKKFTAGASRGITPYGELQDYISRNVPAFAPKEWVANREAWADLQRLKEMKSRYDLFGATLTGNEKNSWEMVTPPRGSSKEQLEEWFDAQRTLIHRAIQFTANAAAKGGWNKKQIEEYTRGVWKIPTREYEPGKGFQ